MKKVNYFFVDTLLIRKSGISPKRSLPRKHLISQNLVIPHDTAPRYLKHTTCKLQLEIHTFLTPQHFLRGENKQHMQAEAYIAFKFSSLSFTWIQIVFLRDGLSKLGVLVNY